RVNGSCLPAGAAEQVTGESRREFAIAANLVVCVAADLQNVEMSVPSNGVDIPPAPVATQSATALAPRRLPATTDSSREAMLVRHQRLREEGHCNEQIAGAACEIEPELLAGGIEGCNGSGWVPIALAGQGR